MLNFFYDSLETLQKVKVPTVQQVLVMLGQFFALLIISWLLFVILDFVWSSLYSILYSSVVWS